MPTAHCLYIAVSLFCDYITQSKPLCDYTSHGASSALFALYIARCIVRPLLRLYIACGASSKPLCIAMARCSSKPLLGLTSLQCIVEPSLRAAHRLRLNRRSLVSLPSLAVHRRNLDYIIHRLQYIIKASFATIHLNTSSKSCLRL